jgi:hypothetical protein
MNKSIDLNKPTPVRWDLYRGKGNIKTVDLDPQMLNPDGYVRYFSGVPVLFDREFVKHKFKDMILCLSDYKVASNLFNESLREIGGKNG